MKSVLIILYTIKTLQKKWSILTFALHPSPEKLGIPISQAFPPRVYFYEAALFFYQLSGQITSVHFMLGVAHLCPSSLYLSPIVPTTNPRAKSSHKPAVVTIL